MLFYFHILAYGRSRNASHSQYTHQTALAYSNSYGSELAARSLHPAVHRTSHAHHQPFLKELVLVSIDRRNGALLHAKRTCNVDLLLISFNQANNIPIMVNSSACSASFLSIFTLHTGVASNLKVKSANTCNSL